MKDRTPCYGTHSLYHSILEFSLDFGLTGLFPAIFPVISKECATRRIPKPIMKLEEVFMGSILKKGRIEAPSLDKLSCESVRSYSEWKAVDGVHFSVLLNLDEESVVIASGELSRDGAKIDRHVCSNDEELIDSYRASLEDRISKLLQKPSNYFHLSRNDLNGGGWYISSIGDDIVLEANCTHLDTCENIKVTSDDFETISLETPCVRRLINSVIRMYGLNRIHELWGLSSYDDYPIGFEIEIERGVLELLRESPKRYYSLLEIGAANVIDVHHSHFITIDRPPTLTQDSDEPLPYYMNIVLPEGMSPELQLRLDGDGDGSINSVQEAWHAFALFHRTGAMTAEERKQLRPIVERMTKVDPKNGRISVNGHLFELKLPSKMGADAAILQGGPNAFAKRLFTIGEAMRSFGPHMVDRWAKGDVGEERLRFIAALPSEVMLRDEGKNSFFSMISFSFYDSSYASANYDKFENRIVTGVESTMQRQYEYIRHELGHSVDDFLAGSDNRRFAFEGSKLFSKHDGNQIEDAFWNFVSPSGGRGMRSSLPPRGLTGDRTREFATSMLNQLEYGDMRKMVFPKYNRTPVEWFAYLFEKPDMWKYATPELRGVVHCFLEGGSAEACTGMRAPTEIDF